MVSKNRVKWIRSLELKKKRRELGLFVAEGPKLVGEILPYFDCECIIATSQWLKENPIDAHVAVDIVSQEELTQVSFLQTPQEVIALFRQPSYSVNYAQQVKQSLCLALDDVQDPGNLGTIVRLADWFGIRDIFCSKSTVDIYNPKSVQATMGSIARVRLHYVDLPEMLAALDADTPIYGTFLDADSIYSQPLQSNGLLVMGNEGKGVSEEVARYINQRLYIPNYPTSCKSGESLNVAIATAIVCAEFRRRG